MTGRHSKWPSKTRERSVWEATGAASANDALKRVKTCIFTHNFPVFCHENTHFWRPGGHDRVFVSLVAAPLYLICERTKGSLALCLVAARSPGGLLETPPCQHATILCVSKWSTLTWSLESIHSFFNRPCTCLHYPFYNSYPACGYHGYCGCQWIKHSRAWEAGADPGFFMGVAEPKKMGAIWPLWPSYGPQFST